MAEWWSTDQIYIQSWKCLITSYYKSYIVTSGGVGVDIVSVYQEHQGSMQASPGIVIF